METLAIKTIGQVLPLTASSDAGREEVCDTHGPYLARQVLRGRWTTCRACVEESHAAEARARSEQLARQRREARTRQLIGRAAIPERFRDRTLDSFELHCDGARYALSVARDYADTFARRLEQGSSLIFCGSVGSGKTHLACGIARRVIEADRMAVFTSVLAAVRMIKETWRKDSEDTESAAIQRLVEPDLLILDEVGVQFGSDTEKLLMFDIINGRYEQMKPTIVISNLAAPKLGDFLGERVLDRLREGGGRVVPFDWPSYRRSVPA
jgi:DNA replication protein DnaC